MKYKMLMYDGHPVKRVLEDRIVMIDQEHETPVLLDYASTIESLIEKSAYKQPWKNKMAMLMRKCDLEEVELKFTKKI